MKAHRGTTVLVLGILALVCNICLIPGILAWTWGASDMAEMERGSMDPAGRETTNVGKILGMVATLLWVVGTILALISGTFRSILGH